MRFSGTVAGGYLGYKNIGIQGTPGSPPPPPPPPPPPGAQPVLTWVGVVDLDNLVFNSTGISLANIRDAGISGNALSLANSINMLQSTPITIPSWMKDEWSTALTFGDFYVGPYFANPLPANSTEWGYFLTNLAVIRDAGLEVGATGWAIDLEPYTGGDRAWDGSDHAGYTAHGLAIGNIMKTMGPAIIYTSSNASFPLSYFDEIAIQNDFPAGDRYTSNLFPYFMTGLNNSGLVSTITDASFHYGVQVSGDGGDWHTGITHSVRDTHNVFPTTHASVMMWPDRMENGQGHFDPSDMAVAFENAIVDCDGPPILYQHELATGTQNPFWFDTLAALATVL